MRFAVFTANPFDEQRNVRIPVSLGELGFTGTACVRDLWQRRQVGCFSGQFTPELPWHGAGLYRVSAAPRTGR